jgi:hypothetical protein
MATQEKKPSRFGTMMGRFSNLGQAMRGDDFCKQSQKTKNAISEEIRELLTEAYNFTDEDLNTITSLIKNGASGKDIRMNVSRIITEKKHPSVPSAVNARPQLNIDPNNVGIPEGWSEQNEQMAPAAEGAAGQGVSGRENTPVGPPRFAGGRRKTYKRRKSNRKASRKTSRKTSRKANRKSRKN